MRPDKDRQNEPWRKQLEALLAGPYAGHGGRTVLARDLDISLRSLEHYITDTATRRDPNFEVRRRIRILAAAKGLGDF